ncbi:hypothetical protein C2845_PM13G09650 [Panicum miliaceum]|uniref:Transposase (putative) gypsy type domain-containing protein n=1 Tax=Panicum miliaceum TaxID=4540 RepID=A0A3L6RJQ3_PANMI|nr:hypothetical protein C2845_PM13G09650 [Panicum miliaceum]
MNSTRMPHLLPDPNSMGIVPVLPLGMLPMPPLLPLALHACSSSLLAFTWYHGARPQSALFPSAGLKSRRVLDFGPSSVDAAGVARARGFVSPDIVLRAEEHSPVSRSVREVVTFLPFLLVELVPPFSPFFMVALEAYAIHLVHLTPNSILTLAIFTHVCEMFFGVSPSVELFRHFFSLCRSSSAAPDVGAVAQPKIVGECYFHIWQGRQDEFIPFQVTGKWEEWQKQWLYTEVDHASPFLRLPDVTPRKHSGWRERPELGAGWNPVLGRIASLRQAGLTSAMVAFDFFYHRLAPLQAHQYPAWFYTGDDDATWFARGAGSRVVEVALSHLMNMSTGNGDLTLALLPERVKPLCDDEARHAVLDTMPQTDARVLAPAPVQQEAETPGHGGVEPDAPVDQVAGAEGAGTQAPLSPSRAGRANRAAGGAADPRGKHPHSCPLVVEISASSLSSSPSSPPVSGDEGQGCSTAIAARLPSSRSPPPKRFQIGWRVSVLGSRWNASSRGASPAGKGSPTTVMTSSPMPASDPTSVVATTTDAEDQAPLPLAAHAPEAVPVEVPQPSMPAATPAGIVSSGASTDVSGDARHPAGASTALTGGASSALEGPSVAHSPGAPVA